MEIVLSSDTEDFIKEQVESGRYSTVAEVIADGLGYVEWKAKTREQIEVGAIQLENGDGIPGEDVEQELEDLSRQWRAGER